MVKIDIPMPKSCGECFAYNSEMDYCNLFTYGIPARCNISWNILSSERPEWCEMEEAEEGE